MTEHKGLTCNIVMGLNQSTSHMCRLSFTIKEEKHNNTNNMYFDLLIFHFYLHYGIVQGNIGSRIP